MNFIFPSLLSIYTTLHNHKTLCMRKILENNTKSNGNLTDTFIFVFNFLLKIHYLKSINEESPKIKFSFLRGWGGGQVTFFQK